MDITRGACDQFKTTSHQQRRRWETIKARRLQVQIEAALSMNERSYFYILNPLQSTGEWNIFANNQ